VANFKVDQRIGKAPFIVQFKDLSSGNPTVWNWEFGDGTTSADQNPRHVYPQEGAYDVRLTVSNQYGSDSVFKTGSSPEIVGTVIVEQTAVVTKAPAIGKTVATTNPAATRAPLSPFMTITALIGLATIVFIQRK
jgi:PKD repeat protein